MSIPTLDPIRHAAVEAELAAIGTGRSRLQRRQRRRRAAWIGAGSLTLVGALTGAAVWITSIPGTTTITEADAVITGEYVGTAKIDLGPRPDGANVAVLDITCEAGGDVSVPISPLGGSYTDIPSFEEGTTSTWNCSDAGRKPTVHIRDGLLVDGATSITVTADPGTEWSVEARYGTATTTDWGVNANGQTYGTSNQHGLPDLQSAQATNGEIGYVLTDDLFSRDRQYIDVYASDGTTVIGKFPNGVEGDGWSWSNDAGDD